MKYQEAPGMDDDKEVEVQPPKRRNHLIYCFLIFLIALACIVAAFIVHSKVTKTKLTDKIGVVVDAGGSGTRLAVYSYNGKGDLKQLHYMKCEKKGLANYKEEDFQLVKDILTKCFDKGSEALPLGKVVPMYFAATAGMRLLQKRNPTFYKKIWDLIRKCIAASKFNGRQAETISGFEEAKWGWVTVNYLKRTLNSSDYKATYGAIDLGSSSMQITFQQKKDAKNASSIKTLDIDGQKKTVYGHSYLCYGATEMERRSVAKVVKDSNFSPVVENPCFQKGWNKTRKSSYLWAVPCCAGEYARNYLGEEITGPANKSYVIKGTGNFTQCIQNLGTLLDRACNKTSCGINGEFQPNISKQNLTFLAFSTFYYIGKSLKLDPTSKKSTFRQKSKELCKKQYNPSEAGKFDYLQCLQASYGYYVLNNGFGLPNDWQLSFIDTINDREVGWTLGLMYMKKDEMYKRVIEKLQHLNTPEFVTLITIGIVLLLVSLGIILIKHFSSRRG